MQVKCQYFSFLLQSAHCSQYSRMVKTRTSPWSALPLEDTLPSQISRSSRMAKPLLPLLMNLDCKSTQQIYHPTLTLIAMDCTSALWTFQAYHCNKVCYWKKEVGIHAVDSTSSENKARHAVRILCMCTMLPSVYRFILFSGELQIQLRMNGDPCTTWTVRGGIHNNENSYNLVNL